MSNQMIFVFDTILRDGTQREGVSFTAEDKLKSCVSLMHLAFIILKVATPGAIITNTTTTNLRVSMFHPYFCCCKTYGGIP
jgi:isopropylmalate/homocitrate/citramalate synthase